MVAALLLAPVDEREAVVSSIETKMVALYAPAGARSRPVDAFDRPISGDPAGMVGPVGEEPRMLNVIDPPVQREGFVEQKIHTYEVKGDEPEEGLGVKAG
jgi:hypothetical protein